MPDWKSHEFIKRIAAALFNSEERRLEKVREQLIRSNKELYPTKPHDGFTFGGKVYDPSNLVGGRRTRVSLHPRLHDDMNDYLKDYEQIWTDRHLISQILHVILKPCETVQDIRDALPNCLVDTLPELKHLHRTREEAFTVQHDARALRQFQRTLKRMEFYATARLMY